MSSLPAMDAPDIVQANVATFMQKIFSRDPLTMVVRAHLYIESALVTLIQVYMEEDVLETDKLSFPSKLQLCIGLGLIGSSEQDVLMRLNRIRNRFVHNLDAALSHKDAYKLMNDLPPRERRQVTDALEHLGVPAGTHMETIAMVFIVLYTKLVSLARGLELMRAADLPKSDVVKKLREIKS